ncbi:MULTISPECIES: SCO1664 family protein [unclassified Streptomyces]|uniref:SCO1664 family protein n=1 Tax=unclassified Streptomyces TaxID=2593676 RepID=UPI0022B72B01|nr:MULTISPECIES: SCO1664 family protein [unclassified Streptomyces]MCZ7413427.1 SCO1664 family protein [Streptomyces sp. WMMC897]MCZ7430421.1 SCO1664 family protein [Streptomyces sp. WMMC1477]
MPAPERIPPRGSVSPAGQGERTAEATAALLARGELTVVGRIADASNAVLYATVADGDASVPCVYKPVAGERPLWDFPRGTLAAREVAAYEVCRALGWELVPPTVLRDGPFGEGMCQEWIGPAPDAGELPPSAADELLALVDGDEPEPGWKAVGFAETAPGRTALLVHADDARLRRLAVLDAVINNADRKGGHLLPLPDGRLYAIDHGVTFHTDDKLRTLLWGWSGEPLPEEALGPLRRLGPALKDGEPLAARLAVLLDAEELEALRRRTADLLATGRHPAPSGQWPAIPWPPV